jgi:hypothetical protein
MNVMSAIYWRRVDRLLPFVSSLRRSRQHDIGLIQGLSSLALLSLRSPNNAGRAATVIGTVEAYRQPPKRVRNADVRARKYLTNAEVDRLIKTARPIAPANAGKTLRTNAWWDQPFALSL